MRNKSLENVKCSTFSRLCLSCVPVGAACRLNRSYWWFLSFKVNFVIFYNFFCLNFANCCFSYNTCCNRISWLLKCRHNKSVFNWVVNSFFLVHSRGFFVKWRIVIIERFMDLICRKILFHVFLIKNVLLHLFGQYVAILIILD